VQSWVREKLVLGVALISPAACATAPTPAKPRALTPAERDSLSGILEPLLTAAELWRGPADGCAAAFGILEGSWSASTCCRMRPAASGSSSPRGTLTRLDSAALRARLAHEIAHMQLGHPDARQARADTQKQTEQG
jgi:hypothetical protein